MNILDMQYHTVGHRFIIEKLLNSCGLITEESGALKCKMSAGHRKSFEICVLLAKHIFKVFFDSSAVQYL